jgi:hypothetical protein
MRLVVEKSRLSGLHHRGECIPRVHDPTSRSPDPADLEESEVVEGLEHVPDLLGRPRVPQSGLYSQERGRTEYGGKRQQARTMSPRRATSEQVVGSPSGSVGQSAGAQEPIAPAHARISTSTPV